MAVAGWGGRAPGQAVLASALFVLAVVVVPGTGASPGAGAGPTGAPAAGSGTGAGAVSDEVVKGVVASVGLVRSRAGVGSSWVAAPGTVVTNEHVSKTGTGDIYVDFSDGRREECYTVVADRDMDLAVLKCDTGGRPTVPLGGAAVPGTDVAVVGYPGGVGPTITKGAVTEERRVIRGIETMGFTAEIQPGSSGSPVFDDEGRVLGIATFGGGYGVPVDRLRPLLEVAERYPPTKEGAEWRLRLRRSLSVAVIAVPIAALVARRTGRNHKLRYVSTRTATAVLIALVATQAQFMLQGPAHMF